ncbi:sterol desaturase family protein [Leptospira sp. 201903070]|uniref:Sterol desaturase family protein n=1 Tax=Leptospira ainlahdjerensis TaxID=2810033 RepID=A0ABS2UDJ6_9LEPT|nr:sterol desaturase family protein [Leptospira ainlahdjerensis]MBM9578437.1 sterol desaturase family protein [Leptospira ainlahdjerensis]
MNPIQCELVLDCVQKIGLFQFTMNILRYYPIAGLAFLILYVWKKDSFHRFRIQAVYPKIEKIKNEFRQSAVTLFVFTIIATTNIVSARMGLIPNNVYFGDYTSNGGYLYMFLSFVLITIWHETWFYWAHRWMHHKKVYSRVHSVHHQSVNPSPLAAYHFHILEAFLEGIYIVFFVLVIPIHFHVLLFHTVYAMVMNIWWHLGYEFLPKGWVKHPILKWINTSTHHNLHHQKFHGNYSLYFNFWDRIMGTNFPNYEEYFESVADKRSARDNDSDSKIRWSQTPAEG